MRVLVSAMAFLVAGSGIALAEPTKWSLSDAAVAWATYVTASEKCNFSLNKKLDVPQQFQVRGYDFNDFRPSGKNSAIVDLKLLNAKTWLEGAGVEQGCSAMQEALEKIWPESMAPPLPLRKPNQPESNFSQEEIKALIDKRTPIAAPKPQSGSLSGRVEVVPQSADAKAKTAVGSAPSTVVAEICNRTSRPLYVFLAHPKAFGEKDWIVRGWFEIGGSSCIKETVPKGLVHYFAESGTKEWNGKEAYYCVPKKPFEKRVFKNEKCVSGERKLGVREVYLEQDTTVPLIP